MSLHHPPILSDYEMALYDKIDALRERLRPCEHILITGEECSSSRCALCKANCERQKKIDRYRKELTQIYEARGHH